MELEAIALALIGLFLVFALAAQLIGNRMRLDVRQAPLALCAFLAFVVAASMACVTSEDLRSIAGNVDKVEQAQRAAAEQQSSYLAQVQEIARKRDLGELNPAQAEQELRRADTERQVKLEQHLAAIADASKAIVERAELAAKREDSGPPLAQQIGVPAIVTGIGGLILNAWRNSTRQRDLARARSGGAA